MCRLIHLQRFFPLEATQKAFSVITNSDRILSSNHLNTFSITQLVVTFSRGSTLFARVSDSLFRHVQPAEVLRMLFFTVENSRGQFSPGDRGKDPSTATPQQCAEKVHQAHSCKNGGGLGREPPAGAASSARHTRRAVRRARSPGILASLNG